MADVAARQAMMRRFGLGLGGVTVVLSMVGGCQQTTREPWESAFRLEGAWDTPAPVPVTEVRLVRMRMEQMTDEWYKGLPNHLGRSNFLQVVDGNDDEKSLRLDAAARGARLVYYAIELNSIYGGGGSTVAFAPQRQQPQQVSAQVYGPHNQYSEVHGTIGPDPSGFDPSANANAILAGAALGASRPVGIVRMRAAYCSE